MTALMDTVPILSLPVHRVTTDDVLAFFDDAIARRDAPRHVVTADASMAVIARRDPELRAILADADLVTPDGAGILWASRLLRCPLTCKVSGVDLVAEAARLSAARGWRLFFLGAAPSVAAEAAERLRERFPGAHIVGTRDGYFPPAQEPDVLAQIRDARPDILFVAFGIPRQEKWIARHKAALGVPISLGIGGSFDVHSGRVRRAPVWMQQHGLEWLHRLAANPKKIGKVMTLPEFVLLALRQRFGRLA
jgi:N-acetylglucosaminyldiphosphoundecaprenol N-acetyl-beta-D-mannosaminyltransferase